MEQYRVSFYDTSDQKLISVILEFTYLEMITDAEIHDLYLKADEVKSNYMGKRAQEIGVCACDGLQVWKKLPGAQWIRIYDVVCQYENKEIGNILPQGFKDFLNPKK